MSPRLLVVGLGAVALMLALLLLRPAGDSEPQPAPKPRPNVVLVSIDTLRADHLTPYGYTARPTSPQLAALAKQGVLFEQAIAAHTNTAPAHASMLTGRYPLAHGLFANGMALPEQHPTLATLLAAEGYQTGAFVSGWTLSKRTRLDRGFDVYDDRMEGLGRREAGHTWKAAKPWLTKALGRDKPVLLFMHFFDPHYPYRPPAKFIQKLAPGVARVGPRHHKLPGLAANSGVTPAEREDYVARYDAEIAYADDTVGQLFAHLKHLDAWDNTIVLVTSDHGETLWERAWVLDHGGRAYEEQLRVPFILHLPGDAHAGTRVPVQVSHVDYLPTLLDVLGLPLPAQQDGESLLGVVRGEASAHRRSLIAHGRTEPKRVPEITAPLRHRALMTAIRRPPHKLIRYPSPRDQEYVQLFDLTADPGERHNLAPQEPDAVSAMKRLADMKRADLAQEPEFSNEVKEQLRALGYME